MTLGAPSNDLTKADLDATSWSPSWGAQVVRRTDAGSCSWEDDAKAGRERLHSWLEAAALAVPMPKIMVFGRLRSTKLEGEPPDISFGLRDLMMPGEWTVFSVVAELQKNPLGRIPRPCDHRPRTLNDGGPGAVGPPASKGGLPHEGAFSPSQSQSSGSAGGGPKAHSNAQVPGGCFVDANLSSRDKR